MLVPNLSKHRKRRPDKSRLGYARRGTDEMQRIARRFLAFVDECQGVGKRGEVLFKIVSYDGGFLGGIIVRVLAAEAREFDIFLTYPRGSDRHEAEVSGSNNTLIKFI